MLNSIYIGLSGMDSYSQGLQTISNNVSNLNTLGFKANTVNFSDFYNSSNGQGGLTYMGSDTLANGAGVRTAPAQVDFTQGNLQQSSGDLDLAIQGSGFLVLKNADGSTFYGRTGQFNVDEKGYISIDNGQYRLAALDPATQQPVALNIDSLRTSAPVATTTVQFSDNISSGATAVDVPNITVFDANGGQHTWDVKMVPVGSGSPGQWTVTVLDETGATLATSTLKFTGSVIDPTTSTIAVSATPAGAPAMSVNLDFSQGVTSFSSGTASTLKVASADGQALGQVTAVTLDDSGHIKVTYSNSKSVQAGAVALADFRDPQQLQRVGSGLFKTDAALKMQYLTSGGPGVGTIVSKEVEASNVDLTQEFGQLILVQRGFQASSQVVSVSNDMIQQLFGIRGQG